MNDRSPAYVDNDAGLRALRKFFQDYLRTLRTALGESAWAELAVVDICLSTELTVVALNNGSNGLALNFDWVDPDSSISAGLVKKLRSRILEKTEKDPLLEDLLFQEEEGPTFRSLSIALLNALSRPLLVAQHLTPNGVGVGSRRMSVDRFHGMGTRAMVIGCGGYLTDLIHAPFIEEITCSDLAFSDSRTMEFFEPYLEDVVRPAQREKKITLSDGADNHKLVEECDLLFISGSALVNDTLLPLLEQAGEKSAVVLEGNTAGLYPLPLFERGVTHFVQTVVDLDYAKFSRRFAAQREAGVLRMGAAEYSEVLLPEMRTLEALPTFHYRRTLGPRTKRILLLQARNWDDPMIGHEIHCFRERIPNEYELACYNIVNGPWELSVLDGFDAVMVGGSGDYGAAFNENPWFKPSLQFLREIVERGFPLFCSCWGHEALAVALGGAVGIDEEGYELGILEIELTEEGARDPLFGTLPKRFTAPLGHSEQVMELPPGAKLMASTERCRVQAYRMGDKPVYSCQFHPELSSERLWERVDAYIPHLRDQRTSPQPASTDNLITDFLSRFVK